MHRWKLTGLVGMPFLLAAGAFIGAGPPRQEPEVSRPEPREATERGRSIGRFVNSFCVECHNREDRTAGLALDDLGAEDVGSHPDAWEKVVRRLATRQMPPADTIRPSGAPTSR